MQRRTVKVKLNDYRMKITIVVYDEDTFIMQHDHTVLEDDTVRLIFRDLDILRINNGEAKKIN